MGLNQAKALFDSDAPSSERFTVVWLDHFVGDEKTFYNAQNRLRAAPTVRQLNLFSDAKKCKDFIKSSSIGQRVILIVSDEFAATLLPKIHPLSRVSAIYLRLSQPKGKEAWHKLFFKVKL